MAAIHEHWAQIRRSLPGRRFQSWYRRCREHDHDRPAHKRVLQITFGVLIMLAGAVMLVTPGPGWLMIGVGAALLARESLFVARLLDRIEITLRRLLRAARLRWEAASLPGRAAVVLIPVVAVVLLGYLAARQLLM